MGPSTLASLTEPPGFLGDFHWEKREPLFGGWSEISVSADGTALAALSDRGAWITGKIIRDAQGRIVDVVSGPVTPLHGKGDGPLPPDSRDSEGMAIAADGTTYVSFEGPARVMRYPQLGGPGTLLPSPPEFVTFDPNGSLEALAVDASGAIYTMPEDTPRDDGFTPVYRFRDGVWDQPWLLPVEGSFVPTGADFGPDGRLYLVERQFRGPAGFASRIRRVTLGPDRELASETLLTTPAGRFGNLEGISIWTGPDGTLRATLVSDDNFMSVLGTELVEFRLPD